MLGALESNQYWHWAAFGKHPVARDFFRVGPDFPLVRAFSDWVENGYRILSSTSEVRSGLCSWRFWAKSFQKESLACGLVRDSSDSLGRPYPLLIMGIGPLSGWEEHWDLLPFACERAWDQIEYVSAQVFKEFKKLETDIQNVRPPEPEWSEFSTKRETLRELDAPSSDLADLEREVLNISEKPEIFVPVDSRLCSDQFTLVNFLHLLLKNHTKVVPSAIFMGGSLERTSLAVFKRPLLPADFIQLWSLSSEGKK